MWFSCLKIFEIRSTINLSAFQQDLVYTQQCYKNASLQYLIEYTLYLHMYHKLENLNPLNAELSSFSVQAQWSQRWWSPALCGSLFRYKISTPTVQNKLDERTMRFLDQNVIAVFLLLMNILNSRESGFMGWNSPYL